jgi:hypothetical protein
MTEAEAYELALMASANGVTSFTVYITFTFGYLAAAYFAGKHLTRNQALIVSALYVFSALSAMLNLLSDLDFYGTALSHAPTLAPQGALNGSEFWSIYMTVLLGAGIVASLYFMWSIRRGNDQ